MYDVIINDAMGASYSGNTTTGIGGSEHFIIKLARALASQDLRVLVRNNRHENPIEIAGVRYESNKAFEDVECRALLLQRCTPLPTNIGFDRLVVQVHDVPGDEHNVLKHFFRRLDATLVCNSTWQRSLYPEGWDSVVIPPMLHHLPMPSKEKEPNSFIYASAACKGFEETVTAWRAFRILNPKLMDARLYVISSGYDAPRVINDPSIIYLGSIDDELLQTYINRCAGLFYINVWEETFGATAAIAECLATRTHILCLNGFGALQETLSDHRFLTDSHDNFRQTFMELYGSTTRQISTKDYSFSTTLSQWLDVLKVK